MDQLVGLSDDLGKLDGYVEGITRKVAAYLGEVLEDQRDKLQENLLANNSEYRFFFLFPFNYPHDFNGYSLNNQIWTRKLTHFFIRKKIKIRWFVSVTNLFELIYSSLLI